MKIAVVGAGISGLSCTYRLVQGGADVTLYEAGAYFGGHSNTVDVTLDGSTFGVDTGFLVFNDRTYPNLIALFAELGVETAPSDMSFSVKLPLSDGPDAKVLEWAGGNIDTVFAQRGNLLRPRFLRMVADILRFNKQATALATGSQAMPQVALGEFLDKEGYSEQFRAWYLLPMAACIWSCPSDQMLAFPVSTFIRFCHNHGLLQVSDRPQWRTVRGGSRNYVQKLLAAIPNQRLATPVTSVTRSGVGARSVRVETADGAEQFDHVVMACHSDQSLGLLADVRHDERAVLEAVRYQPNRAVLHTDASCLPAKRKAWSAWNYQSNAAPTPKVCVHYLLNVLQPLPCTTPVIVSLNPLDEPDQATVLASFDYAHPVFDEGAIAAQQRLATFQGMQGTWFAGAWTGYGFHEDGLKSGLAVAAALCALMQSQSDAAA